MPTPSVINKFRYSDAINRREWDSRYFFDTFNMNVVISNLTGGAAAGGPAETDIFRTQFMNYEQFVTVGNANISPKLDPTLAQLNFAPDAVNLKGVEYDFGITSGNPSQFLIGTDNAFFMRMQWNVATVKGVNLYMGFRILAARNADYTTYTDYAVMGLNLPTGNGGNFWTDTNLNNAGDVAVDSTVAAVDATEFALGVFVDSLGNVTFQLNDQPLGSLGTSQVFQFDTGDTVIPFWGVFQNATTSANALSNWFECGFQS